MKIDGNKMISLRSMQEESGIKTWKELRRQFEYVCNNDMVQKNHHVSFQRVTDYRGYTTDILMNEFTADYFISKFDDECRLSLMTELYDLRLKTERLADMWCGKAKSISHIIPDDLPDVEERRKQFWHDAVACGMVKRGKDGRSWEATPHAQEDGLAYTRNGRDMATGKPFTFVEFTIKGLEVFYLEAVR